MSERKNQVTVHVVGVSIVIAPLRSRSHLNRCSGSNLN